MNDSNKSPQDKTIAQQLTQQAIPIISVAIALCAIHWESMHSEERIAEERFDARAQAMTDTAALALREQVLNQDAPMIMMLIEDLVRDNHDLLSARVGGKNGKSIAETESEHAEGSDSSSARTLTQPILIHDGSGSSTAIGTIDLRFSTKEVDQAAGGNAMIMAIEGGLCALLCCGLILLKRKQSVAGVPSAKRAGTEIHSDAEVSTPNATVKTKPATSRDNPKPAISNDKPRPAIINEKQESASSKDDPKPAIPREKPKTPMSDEQPKASMSRDKLVSSTPQDISKPAGSPDMMKPASSHGERAPSASSHVDSNPIQPEPRGIHPSSAPSDDDEPVEVALNSPPAAGDTN
jgi:hypothetical protein